MAIQYFNVVRDHSTLHFKTPLAVALMGIITFGILVGAIVAVKKKQYNAHKDLMIGMMVYLFVGAGVVRWIGSLLSTSSPDACIPPWHAAVSAAISYLIVQPGLLVSIYWRLGSMSRWYNQLVTALSFVICFVSFISLVISFGTDWTCSSMSDL